MAKDPASWMQALDDAQVTAVAELAAARLAAFSELADGAGPGDWSKAAWQLVDAWIAEDGLTATTARHGTCTYRVLTAKSAQPAFAANQRQALLVTARLEPERARTGAKITPTGRAVARGGWLTALAVTAAGALARWQRDEALIAGRDLAVTIEMPHHGDDDPLQPWSEPTKDDSRPVLDALATATAAIGGIGAWSLQTGKRTVHPIPIAQKGLLKLRVAVRGGPVDGAIPAGTSAVDQVRGVLDAVAAMGRPWRATASAKAFVTTLADNAGVGKALAWRALLGGGPWRRVLARFPNADRSLLDALFHDTVTAVAAHAPGDAGDVGFVDLDVRLLPGTDRDAVLKALDKVLGGEVKVDVLQQRPAMEAPLHHPLMRELVAATERCAPAARVAPMLLPGHCDALGWRQSTVPCFGFAPLRPADTCDFLREWTRGTAAAGDDGLRWGARTFIDGAIGFCVQG